jgi:EAL domain-containing protein (putative c-di-GMP-specific phosphodiesterase class I)
MHSQTAKSNDPVAHLRHALAADAFTLYCQPIVALAGSVAYPIGEVLVRLREEEKSLRPPGEFLPVLEHYGMMPEFDRWVVRQALRQLANGCRIPRLSINLSAQTLADRAFPAYFADALLASGLEGDRVLFEIEETDAAAVPECMARFAATVGSLGSGVIIDGLGRASDPFASLRAPCVQFIKLHSRLTRHLIRTGPTPETGELLRATSEVGIHAIAECVEERNELLRLKALKIGYAQGFGIYQPHPIEAFAEAASVQAA